SQLLLHLHALVEAAHVLLGGARRALDESLVDAGPELDRGPVRRDDDGVAGGDPAKPRVAGRQRDLGVRALELKLLDPLDRRPGEERAVADEAQRRASAT